MTEKHMGELIRQARENKGISQEKLAEYVGVSRQAVSKWEKDLAAPTADNIRRIEQALELEAGTLSAPTPAEEGVAAEKRRGKAALWVLLILLAGAGGFLGGRMTAPVSEPAPEAPAVEETKTIWKYTKLHQTWSDGQESLSEYTFDDMGRTLTADHSGRYYPEGVRGIRYTYDEAGNLIQKVGHLNGKDTWKDEFEYDALGNQTLFRSMTEEGEWSAWDEHNYDERGNLLSIHTYDYMGELVDSCRYTYTYHEDGSYEREYHSPSMQYDGETYRGIAWFDANGNMVKEENYRMDGSLISTTEYTWQSFEVPADFEETALE